MLINRHLDHEEEAALPLIRRHYSAAEWDADGKVHLKETRADMPMFVGIMFDHMNDAEIAGAIAAAPIGPGVAVQALVAPALRQASRTRLRILRIRCPDRAVPERHQLTDDGDAIVDSGARQSVETKRWAISHWSPTGTNVSR